MIRLRIFSLASLLSLLLCVTTAVLWLRGYFVYDVLLTRAGDSDVRAITSVKGKIAAYYGYNVQLRLGPTKIPLWWRTIGGNYTSAPSFAEGFEGEKSDPWWKRLGFQFSFRHFTQSDFQVTAPDWFVVLLTLILPVIWLRTGIRHRHRRRSGLCPVCSYNLTGNISGVCPECGRAVPERSMVTT
jgi:hypothetical protein